MTKKQKIIRISVGIVLLMSSRLAALFEHDRAVIAARDGEWAKAQSLLSQCLVHNPDDPALAYDAGVASYRQGDYERALAYFDTSATHEQSSASLKELALFNMGNAYAQRQEYEKAIAQYDRVLAANAAHERAAHNKKVLEEKIRDQQQKQQQEQKDKNNEQDKKESNDQQKKDQKKENADEQDTRDDEQQENDGAKQSDGSSQHGDQQEKDKQEKGDEPGLKPQQEQKRNGADEHKKESRSSDTNERDAQHESKRDNDAKRKHDGQAQEQEREKQHNAEQRSKDNKDRHKKPFEDVQDNLAQYSENQVHEQKGQQPSLDPRLAKLLQASEAQDAHTNKELIKARVGKQMAGRHGQQCW